MGAYELIQNSETEYELHYTGDGWSCAIINKEQAEAFKRGELDVFELEFN